MNWHTITLPEKHPARANKNVKAYQKGDLCRDSPR